MITLYPLFSGSSGNATYIEFSDNKGILVDVGRSAKQIEKSLLENNIDVKNIKAIFLTHEHTDHIIGLKVFSHRHNIKIYGSAGTINAVKTKYKINNLNLYDITSRNEEDLGFISVKSFEISHDCVEGLGYVFTSQSGEKTAICTDLGYISESVKNALKGCEMVVLESNHDTMMLQNGPYPYYLKRRILSDSGHLSNESCSEILPYLVNKGTKNIILSHLSAHNNLPELAFQTAIYHLNNYGMEMGRDFSLSIAPKINENGLNFKI